MDPFKPRATIIGATSLAKKAINQLRTIPQTVDLTSGEGGKLFCIRNAPISVAESECLRPILVGRRRAKYRPQIVSEDSAPDELPSCGYPASPFQGPGGVSSPSEKIYHNRVYLGQCLLPVHFVAKQWPRRR